MRRYVAFFAFLLALVGAAVAPIAAQEANVDNSFSNTIVGTLGYPEIEIAVSEEGVEAPSTLETGYYLVTLSAAEPYVAYANFMQPPVGLSKDEATELALAAAGNDLAQEGWVYAGGNNTFDLGVPVQFVINLQPGEYQIAASYYLPDQGSEEIMRLVPLTVTELTASPAVSPMVMDGPPSTVTLEMTDELRYVVSPDPVPSGPQLWKLTNTGEMHAHHVVMTRIPDDVTAEDIVAEFTSLMSGTPPASEPLVAQFVFTGYAALQSGGQTTWVEFDLDPGAYAVICYIIDPMTGRPHVLDGMATVFTVA